jgi:hypothetical protein
MGTHHKSTIALWRGVAVAYSAQMIGVYCTQSWLRLQKHNPTLVSAEVQSRRFKTRPAYILDGLTMDTARKQKYN